MPKGKGAKNNAKPQQAESYQHPESDSPMRPDVGTQAQFRKRKPPQTYRYDSSLSPALDWDGQNSARVQGEAAIEEISRGLTQINADIKTGKVKVENGSAAPQALAKAREAAEKLKALSRPFLNWAGKAERLSFDVPTLPLFVHERLSNYGILETLKGHRRDKQQTMFELFGDPQHSVTDQVLRAYQHRDQWVNRMVLGDSLVVMNSLLHYEGLGGQVQMIYMDPPYGVKFGSNFQPFVRKRDVSHSDDEDMTREPEMVQAYRDTWELGLHSYLTYMRDRLLLARDLLSPSGSIFVQISDENLHAVRGVVEEVFGTDNYLNVIPFAKTSGVATRFLPSRVDFLIWYARDKSRAKFRELYIEKSPEAGTAENYTWLELAGGTRRGMTVEERRNRSSIPRDARIYKPDNIATQGNPAFEFEFYGKSYKQPWKTNRDGMVALAAANRLHVAKNSLQYVRYLTDFPCVPVTQLWEDTQTGSFTEEKIFAVQTGTKTVERCLLMTTDPGDLVLDPTCGSGTTAYVAEQWGRRWITIDTSRVPLALARQRLLTATFPWYELTDDARGPAGGFVYQRKQNNKGEEVGGIVPHVTLKSIANNEPPQEEVLVDRPEADNKITRVTGAFCVEGTIPTPVDLGVGAGLAPPSASAAGAIRDLRISDSREVGAIHESPLQDYVDRMLEVLRRSPVLRLGGNKTLMLRNIRPPAKTLSLSAEAMVENGAANGSAGRGTGVPPVSGHGQDAHATPKPVALVFGPENGAVSESLVFNAAREAFAKSYSHLYVIGFAIQPNARELIEKCAEVVGVAATYIQATPDLMMGDLLKNMRSSQIFSVCGLPEIKVHPAAVCDRREEERRSQTAATTQFQVELLGLDVFDPITMDVHHRTGDDVPAWFLDTDYNGLCFHVSQAFFPRTGAWDNLKKALKGEFEESVWEHLAGTMSAPFEAGEHAQIAVKVIDDRGNELMVIEKL